MPQGTLSRARRIGPREVERLGGVSLGTGVVCSEGVQDDADEEDGGAEPSCEVILVYSGLSVGCLGDADGMPMRPKTSGLPVRDLPVLDVIRELIALGLGEMTQSILALIDEGS